MPGKAVQQAFFPNSPIRSHGEGRRGPASMWKQRHPRKPASVIISSVTSKHLETISNHSDAAFENAAPFLQNQRAEGNTLADFSPLLLIFISRWNGFMNLFQGNHNNLNLWVLLIAWPQWHKTWEVPQSNGNDIRVSWVRGRNAKPSQTAKEVGALTPWGRKSSARRWKNL